MRKLLGEIIFWGHLPIFLAWFLPFAIPSTVWPTRVVWHFSYMAIIFIVQYSWGLIFLLKINKYVSACPWTTLNQFIRGFPLSDERNYKHSFVAELASKTGIRMSAKKVLQVMCLTFGIVIIQLFLYLV